MRLYNKLWNEIKTEDWPKTGEMYICLDPQKRLGDNTWSVGIMGDGSFLRDSIGLGLFWELPLAQRSAGAMSELLTIQELQYERGWLSTTPESHEVIV